MAQSDYARAPRGRRHDRDGAREGGIQATRESDAANGQGSMEKGRVKADQMIESNTEEGAERDTNLKKQQR